MTFRLPGLMQSGAMATGSPLKDLATLIRSRTPLIAVESNEEPQVVSAEIRQTRPLSVVMAEKVDELREWAANRTVPCD